MMQKKNWILLFLGVWITISGFSSWPERVEPPFWWAGMKNPDLQLLVYGKEIARSEVSLTAYPGVTLKTVSRLANPDYVFLDLTISTKAKPGTFEVVFTPPKGKPARYRYTLKQRESGSAQRRGFDPSDVIYLVMPDRFANGDPGNDTVPGMLEGLNREDPYGRHGGDLQGIIDHLDYIRDMGFTQLWLNPVLENNMKKQSYHGYAITDFYRVDPRLGDNELYRQLAEKARAMGIGMIMDMVFNHCGANHWWMKNPPSPDWINHYPDFVPTNHRRTVHKDPHASAYDTRGMVDGWFVPSMPDLNQRNPFLANYLIQNSIWWIEYAHLTGIRMDTYPYPDKWMMAEWNRRVLAEYPHFNIVGEEWSLQPGVIAYWQRGQINHDHYRGNLPSLMDFPLQHALANALTHAESWNQGWINLYETMAMDFLYPDPGNLVVFPDNHDMARFYMQVGMNPQLFKMGITYILTTRGIPQIFYGTENLMTHTEGNGHGVIRKDFPGGWPGDPVNAFTGENMSVNDRAMQLWMKKMLNWRKRETVLHDGKLIHFAPFDGIYTYFRQDTRKLIMVIMNKNKDTYPLPLARFQEVIGTARTGTEVLSGKTYQLQDTLNVPPVSALVLEINK